MQAQKHSGIENKLKLYFFTQFALKDLNIKTKDFVKNELDGLIKDNKFEQQEAIYRLSNILNKPKLFNAIEAATNKSALTALINNTLTAEEITKIAEIKDDKARLAELNKSLHLKATQGQTVKKQAPTELLNTIFAEQIYGDAEKNTKKKFNDLKKLKLKQDKSESQKTDSPTQEMKQ